MAKLFAMHNLGIFRRWAGYGTGNIKGVKAQKKNSAVALYKYRTGFEAAYNTLI